MHGKPVFVFRVLGDMYYHYSVLNVTEKENKADTTKLKLKRLDLNFTGCA